MTNAVLVLIGALGGGLLATLAKGFFNRNKVKAETGMTEAQAADILTRAATDLLAVAMESAKETEARLSREVEALRFEVVKLRRDVEALTQQLLEEGITPRIGDGANGRKR